MQQRPIRPFTPNPPHPAMPDHLSPEEDELELEPVDPEILAQQRQRGQRKTDHAQAAVDADLVRQAEILGDPFALEDLKKFRFTTRHLMILTALLALIMTFCQLWGAGLGLFVTATIAVAAGWFFTMRREQRQRQAVEQLRSELAAQQERRTGPERSLHGQEGGDREENHSRGNGDRPEQQAELNFSFSLREMLIAFTAAAVLLGLVSLFGPGPLAILLGMIALGGLVAQAIGLTAPGIFVFGWWILLVLYLLLGLWSSTTSNEGAVGGQQGAVTIPAVDGNRESPTVSQCRKSDDVGLVGSQLDDDPDLPCLQVTKIQGSSQRVFARFEESSFMIQFLARRVFFSPL